MSEQSEPSSEPDQSTHIIRVHTAGGQVYARYMGVTGLDFGEGPVYSVDGQAEVPTGDQQMVVDWFRGAGWTVEQDHGTSFDAPQWGP
jgi:hypothetical protein